MIDILFNIIDNGILYASEVKTPFLSSQVLQMAYHSVSSSGIYTYACKYWCRKISADETWDNFKKIALEYSKLREE